MSDSEMTADQFNAAMAKPKRSKYGNTPTEVDGYRFASLAEAKRYRELKLMVQADDISDLQLQVRFPIEINGITVCTYVADFVYYDGGNYVVEDVKGKRTPMYQLKKRLMKAVWDYDIREVYQ